MTTYAFPPHAIPTVPVEGSGALFPVRRILCVGRNYAAHRREMGGDDRDPPFFFAKPADAIAQLADAIAYPPATSDLHHEIELVVALKAGGADLSIEQALACVFGYAVGVDLTRRDLQAAAKAKGQPWEAGKAFDQSAPISAIRVMDAPAAEAAVTLSVNGQERQRGQVGDMIWNIGEVIAKASQLWTLAAGDLIFTGTPEGVAAIVRGDKVVGEIEGVGRLDFTLV
ncbi:fumarylacetoacetate hydrolase family protein [Caulobacter vibrioides]|uniref:Fumarylacetoacetate hydrolase family protein n=2 Tax=Caulobacter vibrioides TaxID=155892 RepID=Q9A2J4_CAUVC|nr:fumarylacetoacetate hydrolase family protein [Caulobacter vibrioides]YP_002519055.1 fumarylacetoacetate hydrolase family protein [Caulobacter vibrioides NA1000]AAK25529.1 fumarylacetoacetate hydrolase family protein [Caulobacter vibrioides CB15]ACL97147.1 fumarylacetoacetate hydrolase family protein [Caulobacter vibrioides NA1000]ATC30377.1 FAA hydrolase family protein [Caulobacter vibrioides]QXZ51907.1 fumarylacetoacetate hydrolase family protein [Caulobacter vibrioides]